ncbi:MAG: SDR family oxidoreductase, partial [Silvanigrellaceae bacterium]|nr:SDR family oxidoreductase [Silvanigrellaceae bacterium]
IYKRYCLPFEMDVTHETSVANVLEALTKKNINVDILINNAARNPSVNEKGVQLSDRIESLSIENWYQDIHVGMTGAVICAKVFGTQMAKKGKGNIINVASDLAVIAPDQRLYAHENLSSEKQPVKPISYSAVKHGLIGITKYLSTYWPDRNVRCNSISPGGILNNQNESFINKICERIPMKRMARSDEYQGAMIFLCSEASSYMNGANLVIDGGRSVW